MKYIFIAGLEHSGTTLTDYLLSQAPNAIGLGEVAQFFAPQHMKNYIEKWGDQPDVELCSCHKSWLDCDFWSDVIELNGLNSDKPIVDKYQALFKHIDKKYGNQTIVIDSSKTMDAFQSLEPSLIIDKGVSQIHIVFTCKDVRSFGLSIVRKSKSNSLLSIFRSFNWWVSVNYQWLQYLEKTSNQYTINLYEYLCHAPQGLIDNVIGSNVSGSTVGVSHIAMGNKNFTSRNTHHITYDDEWRSNWKIKFIYLLHFKARRLNRRLYKLAAKESK